MIRTVSDISGIWCLEKNTSCCMSTLMIVRRFTLLQLSLLLPVCVYPAFRMQNYSRVGWVQQKWTADDNHSKLIDWIQALHHTRHKIGHFGDVPQASVLAWYGKSKPNTTKAHVHHSKEMDFNTKQTQKSKARFSRLLRHSGLEMERAYSGFGNS